MKIMKGKHRVVAALNVSALNSFCNFLLILVYGYDDSISRGDVARMRVFVTEGKEFFALLGVTLTQLNTIIKQIALAKGDVDEATDNVLELAETIKQGLPNLLHNNDVSKPVLTMLRHWANYMMTDSPTAYRFLTENAGMFKDSGVASLFIPETEPQGPYFKQIESLVYRHFKRKGTTITAEEKAKLKIDNVEAFKKYNALQNQIRAIYKAHIRSIIRTSGKDTLPMATMVKELDTLGIKHSLQRKFVGLIDEAGKLYTVKGLAIHGGSPQMATLKMNPDYNPNTDDSYVFTAQNEGGKPQYYYTSRYVANKRMAPKFELVDDFVDRMPAVRSKWIKDLRDGEGKIGLMGALTEIVYLTGMRIGSANAVGAGGEDSVGLLTLKGSNVKRIGSGYRISYFQKRVDHVIEIKPNTPTAKKIIGYFDEAVANLEDPDDFLWKYEKNGRLVRLTYAAMSAYFKSLGGGITIHKVREALATKIFKEGAEASGLYEQTEVTPQEAQQVFNDIVAKIAEQLGHYNKSKGVQKLNGGTSIGHYIPPTMMANFFDRLGVRYPAAVDRVLTTWKKISGGK